LRDYLSSGYVKKCLIPFEPTFGDKFKRGKVVGIDVIQKTVELAGGESVSYDELVIATGTTGPFPCKLPVEVDSKDAILRYESMVDKVFHIYYIFMFACTVHASY
jgi:NADPH-dependent 2,4-dienoyl-CoA reductase/sulfur reductase-like enzyme